MARHFCPKCVAEKEMITVHQASRFIEVSRTTLYKWMKKELIHWAEIPSGRRVICRDSLSGSSQIYSEEKITVEKCSNL